MGRQAHGVAMPHLPPGPKADDVVALRAEFARFRLEVQNLLRTIPVFRFVTVRVFGGALPCLIPRPMDRITDAMLTRSVTTDRPETARDVGTLSWYKNTDPGAPGIVINLNGADVVSTQEYELRILFIGERA